MKHEQVIRRVIAEFHESWMNDDDKRQFDEEMIAAFGEQLASEIDAGIAKGHSAEEQERLAVSALRAIFTSEKPVSGLVQ